MRRTLEILPPDIPKQMNPGENQEVTLFLRRIGGDQLIGYHGELEPDHPQETWVRIVPDSMALDPIHPDCALVTLHLTVPPDANSGTHGFNVKFTAEDQSSAIEEVKIIIEVPNPLVAWLWRYLWLIILLCILAAVTAAILWFNPGPTPQANDNTTTPPTATVLADASAATTTDPTLLATAKPITGTVREFANIPFVYVPAGDFFMGANNVTCDLPGFWIMKTEVSNDQFRKWGQPNETYTQTQLSLSNHPVVGVSWEKSAEFAKWFQENLLATEPWASVRLPTNEEWEKACRGTDGRTYPWGEESATPSLLQSTRSFEQRQDRVSAPIDSFPNGASPSGALQMLGNVWEWTNTISGTASSETAYYFKRGGSFNSAPIECSRNNYTRIERGADLDLGFRLVVVDASDSTGACRSLAP